MKTRKFLTLTRSRQIDALCWVLILAASLLARLYPVRSLPLPLRVGAAAVLLAMAAAIILIAAGIFTEKGDERSAENERRADSALFTLLFVAMGLLLIVSGKVDGWSITLGREDVLILFSSACLAKDLLFLGYERFSA